MKDETAIPLKQGYLVMGLSPLQPRVDFIRADSEAEAEIIFRGEHPGYDEIEAHKWK